MADRLEQAWGGLPLAWPKWAVIAGVVLLSAYLGPRASVTQLAIVPAIVALNVLLRTPELGVVAFLLAALVVPLSLGTNTQTAPPIAIVFIPVLVGIWLLRGWRQHSIRPVASAINLPLLTFAVSATLSLIAGNLPWNLFAVRANPEVQVGAWAIFILSFLALLLVGNLIGDVRWLKRTVAVLFGVGAFFIAARLRDPSVSLSGSSVLNSNTGSMFWTWLVALAGGQALFNRSLSRPWRVAAAMLVVLSLYVGWFQSRNWVSGWLPPLVAVLVLVWLYSWRLGLAVTLIGGVAVFIAYPTLLDELTGIKQYSIDTRVVARDILLTQVFPLSPVLGLGPANYYHYTPLYPILGWNVKFNSHNNYIDLLLQVGVVGTAAFAWLMAVLTGLGWRLRRQVDAWTDKFSIGYVNGCIAGLVATLVACGLGDWFLPFVYNIGFAGMRASLIAWIFLGGLVAIEQIARRPAPTGA